MTQPKCLNCGNTLHGKFCSGCGQKADTHRLSLSHFIFHDVLHGAFHLERGMLYTAKQALVRPGAAAMEYIAGKRVKYYNIFYFVLILLGLTVFITHAYNVLAMRIDPSKVVLLQTDKTGARLESIFDQYGKLFIFLVVPVFAWNSWLIFRKHQLNYTEHVIVSGMYLLCVFLIITIYLLFQFLFLFGLPEWLFELSSEILPYALLAYLVYLYTSAFCCQYKRFNFLARLLGFLALVAIELLLFFVILIGIITDWQGGEMMFSIE